MEHEAPKLGQDMNIQAQRNNVARGYSKPGCADLPAKRGFNFGSGGDEHETAIFLLCLKARRQGHEFLTQAQDRLTGEIADFVDLDDGIRLEVETDPLRAARFKGRKDVLVISLWENSAFQIQVQRAVGTKACDDAQNASKPQESK